MKTVAVAVIAVMKRTGVRWCVAVCIRPAPPSGHVQKLLPGYTERGRDLPPFIYDNTSLSPQEVYGS